MTISMKENSQSTTQPYVHKMHFLLFAVVFGFVGAAVLVFSFAATPVNNTIEPETGIIKAPAIALADTTASTQNYVSFQAPAACAAGQTGTPPNCTSPAGTTLPPGSALPDDATCSARVIKTSEIRPQNASQNATKGTNKNLTASTFRGRVDGNYTGTTDEILQWVACKWGIDPDVVRAQAAKESYWTMSTKGDYTTDPDRKSVV